MRNPTAVATLILCMLSIACTSACEPFASKAEAEKPTGPPLEYLGAWGARGDGPGHLQEAAGIATDKIGNIYIADAGSRFVHKFGPTGKPLLSFQEDSLKHPQSIAVDLGGAIYVTDPVRKSVFICLPSGERDRFHELHLKTKSGKENTLGVSVADDGLIYVLDSEAGKVSAFNNRFRLALSWQPREAAPESKGRPSAIAIGADTSVYVSDPANNRILKFTRDGSYISEIRPGPAGNGSRLSSEFAVTANYIFAMDADGRMLHVWTLDGVPKLAMDLAPELGQASRPAPALAVSPRGELLVLDEPESRVLRYRINF
jgi:DNA-binding beta-propeller fold protein YncE